MSTLKTIPTSMSDMSDDIILSDLESDDEIAESIIQVHEEIISRYTKKEENKEDEAVAGFIPDRSKQNKNYPPSLSFGSIRIGEFAFHPNADVIALGLSNGCITMYKYSNQKNEYLRTNYVHSKHITVLKFDEKGDHVYSASKDNSVSVSDTETGEIKVLFGKAQRTRKFITTLTYIDANTFATGDEDGVVKVWDIRANGCRFSLKKSEESINSIIKINSSNNQPKLACTSSDGTMTIIDLISKRMDIQSEPCNSELTACVTMKREVKLVCGTDKGSLITFDVGNCSVSNDEIHSIYKHANVNKLIPVTENIVLSALDNGKIRATHLFPNYHLGIIGYYQNMSVDLLDISRDGRFIASSSCLDNTVKFWNIELFKDLDVKKNNLKDTNGKDFNLPSSNVVNALDFFRGF